MMMRRLLSRRLADDRGSATIEFAFIAPVLIVMYFGVTELSLALEASRKASSTASMIGDLVAQTEDIDQAELNAILAAADAVMRPLDATGMKLRVTSLVMDYDEDIEVAWSSAQNQSPYACGIPLTPPDGVLTPGQSVIMSEVRYLYTPPIGYYLTGDIEFRDTFYLRPRRSLRVEFQPDPC